MKTTFLFVMMFAALQLLQSCGNSSYHTNSYKDVVAKNIEENPNATTASADSSTAPQNFNTEEYDNIVENQFLDVTQQPLSTFSIDVDRAAYSNVRRYIQSGSLPPKGAVRIEEMINYFDYHYPQPTDGKPFSIITETGVCPWASKHKLVHIGLQGKNINKENLPPSNLVFLIDVSGSMNEPNKLPLVKESLKMLTDQLRPKDKVAIVVYAGNAGQVLPSTSGANKMQIKDAIDNLEAGGSTAGGEGIKLAYDIAKSNFVQGGNNRIILATDGDFNVGVSSEDELVNLIEQERKTGVYLTILGFGVGNYKDDKMQQLADKGNGNHAYIDNIDEAKKTLVKEFGGTLFTIAKDVKLQIEFNPAIVKAYRLIGYENRLMQNEDFNNDKKDAGELGAGHTVTALYEIIPAGEDDDFVTKVDKLKYQNTSVNNETNNGECMTIKLRYKQPAENESNLMTHTVFEDDKDLTVASNNFKFSAAVAEFGLLLRQSAFKQNANYHQTMQLAKDGMSDDEDGYRSAFVALVKSASELDVK